ncbi:MAG: hypothetical protein GC185_01530 [Alphaproteobacteria bacterium]|nr:hypothetical protein [Alphaproteobacteria bacterium]
MGALLLDFSAASTQNGGGRQKGFDYDAAVAETYRAFPELKDRLFFYDLGKDCWVHPDPQMQAEIPRRLAEAPGQYDILKNRMEHFKAEKNSCAMYGPDGTRVIMLYTGGDTLAQLGPNADKAQNLQFTFDHELGHVICRNGGRSLDSLTRHENVADTYAAMRHFQRYGLDSPMIAQQILWRAQRVVSLTGMRHAEHFTGFVTEKLLADKDRMGLDKLSIAQTAQLAGAYATQHTPPDMQVKNLASEFNGFQKTLEQQNVQAGTPGLLGAAQDEDGNDESLKSDTAFRALAQTVLATKSADALHWGAKVLDAYMNGLLGATRNGKILVKGPAPEILSGPYWQNIRRTLDVVTAHEKTDNKPRILMANGQPYAPPEREKGPCPTKRMLMARPSLIGK